MKVKQQWFRPKELADRWRVSRTTIWRWCKAGDLPRPTKLGKRTVAWRRSVVLAFEEARS